MNKPCSEETLLNAPAIDRLSELCAESLEAAGVNPKDRLRMRLSLEEILLLWQAHIPDARVRFRIRVRKTRTTLEFSVPGTQVDPGEYESELLLNTRLQAQAGFPLVYSYAGGCNLLIITTPSQQRLSKPARLGIAVVSALLLGLLLRLRFPAAGAGVLQVVSPLLSRLMGLIKAVSSPLIFLSVCCGILGMGNLSVAGRIGKVAFRSGLLGTLLTSCAVVLLTGWLFPIRLTGSGIHLSELDAIWANLLDALPGDIVSPFANGNVLQIIFMAAFTAVILIILGEKAAAIRQFTQECGELFSCAMELISHALPFVVFLSVLNLILYDRGMDLSFVLKFIVLKLGVDLVLLLFMIARVCLRYKVSPALLCRKCFPAWFIALSTCSSSAALSESIRVCEHDLGISGKLTNFGVPLMQILFSLGSVSIFTLSAFCMAEAYGVVISPAWVLTAVFLGAFMAISTPPVAGGATANFALLFIQLGIPAEAVAVAASIDLLVDPFTSSTNVLGVEMKLILLAGKLGLLNTKVLCRKPKEGTTNG